PVPAPPPGPTRPAAGGGAVHRRPARGGDGAAGRAAGHRRADGPHRRTARPAARPSAAERAARRPTRHPSPRDRQAPARVPSLEADRTMTAPTPPAHRLAVLGAGSWGTTFARVLADGGAEVVLWARREEIAREIREEHRNRAYLPQHDLPGTVHGTSDLDEALDGADGVVIAVPAQSLRTTLE